MTYSVVMYLRSGNPTLLYDYLPQKGLWLASRLCTFAVTTQQGRLLASRYIRCDWLPVYVPSQ